MEGLLGEVADRIGEALHDPSAYPTGVDPYSDTYVVIRSSRGRWTLVADIVGDALDDAEAVALWGRLAAAAAWTPLADVHVGYTAGRVEMDLASPTSRETWVEGPVPVDERGVPPVTSWRMYGVRLRGDAAAASRWTACESDIRTARCYAGGRPDSVVPVVARLDSRGEYAGWVETGSGELSMVQHRRVFDIQFPYGYRVEQDAGMGCRVRLSITADGEDL